MSSSRIATLTREELIAVAREVGVPDPEQFVDTLLHKTESLRMCLARPSEHELKRVSWFQVAEVFDALNRSVPARETSTLAAALDLCCTAIMHIEELEEENELLCNAFVSLSTGSLRN